MSDSARTSVNRRRPTLIIASLVALLAAATGLVVVPQLAGAAPAPTVVITAGRASMIGVDVPADTTKYAPFVFKDTAFRVHFTAAPGFASPTKLTLSIDSGKSKGLVLGTLDVDANVTAGDIVAPAGLSAAANDVALKISAKGTGVTAGTTKVDVVDKYVTTASGLTGIGAGGAPDVPCTPSSTPGNQTCGDLLMPDGVPAVLTQGLCTQACNFTAGSVLQWLSTVPGIDNGHPVTFIAKCDKSLCAGKGVSSYTVKVQTKITDDQGNPIAPVRSEPCAAKGVVDQYKDFCTDYVQSKRDGAGDVLLYVLFAADAKIIW